MKKRLAIILSATLIVAALFVGVFTLSVSAYYSGDYTYSVSNGEASITEYSGSKTLSFKSNPQSTSISKLSAGTKKLTVSISKKSTQVTGYQIQYSTSKSFKSPKSLTIDSYKTTSATLSSLSAKKTYYVHVHTYKVVDGKKYYSAWSSVKSQKTK